MAFAISDLDSVMVDFDASDITSLSDGDDVTSWTDRSDNSVDLSAASGEEPVYRASAINSLPAVEFDGSVSRLTNGATQLPISTTKNLACCLVTKADVEKTYNGWWILSSALPATSINDDSCWSVASGLMYQYRLSQNVGADIDPATAWCLITFVRGKTLLHVAKDGAAIMTSVSAGQNFTTADRYLTVGMVGPATSYLDGRLAALVIFDETEQAERMYIEGVLAHRYGITLDSAHPFASAAPTSGPGSGGGGGGGVKRRSNFRAGF